MSLGESRKKKRLPITKGFRVSTDESEAIRIAAERANVSESEYLRHRIVDPLLYSPETVMLLRSNLIVIDTIRGYLEAIQGKKDLNAAAVLEDIEKTAAEKASGRLQRHLYLLSQMGAL